MCLVDTKPKRTSMLRRGGLNRLLRGEPKLVAACRPAGMSVDGRWPTSATRVSEGYDLQTSCDWSGELVGFAAFCTEQHRSSTRAALGSSATCRAKCAALATAGQPMEPSGLCVDGLGPDLGGSQPARGLGFGSCAVDVMWLLAPPPGTE